MNTIPPKIAFCFEPTKLQMPVDLPAAYSVLWDLKRRGKLEIDWLPLNSLPQANEQYRAVVIRPLWGGILRPHHVKRVMMDANHKKPFLIATLSAGTSKIHLSLRKDRGKTWKIITGGGGNADATAELVVWHAISLRRQLHKELRALFAGKWPKREGVIGSLQGITWTLFGDGNIAQSLISKLPALGIKNAFIYKPAAKKGNKPAFTRKTIRALLKSVGWRPYSIKRENIPTEVFRGTLPFQRKGQNFSLTLTTNRKLALRTADVVSLHFPLTTERDGGRAPTKGSFRKEDLDLLHKNVILINPSRAEIVHPSVANGKPFEKSRHFSTDVFPEEIESTDLDSMSDRPADNKAAKDLWERMKTDPRRVMITPHAGGVPPDAQDRIAANVFGELIERLLGMKFKKTVDFANGREITSIKLV